MFNWLMDVDNYDDRKVARFEQGNLMVDTVAVSDGQHPYETAIAHPSYNNGGWIVVEAYDSKTGAQLGHERWVQAMTGEMPVQLVDCGNSHLKSMSILLGGDAVYPKQEEKHP